MMEKYKFQIILLILFTALALFLHQYRKGTTLGARKTAFAVNDTERVTGINITDEGGRISLQKSDEGWVLNSRYNARVKAVELILQTLERIRAAAPAPVKANERLINMPHDEFIRVGLLIGGRRRAYLLYSEGPGLPTYILRQGSSQAFIAEVLGFEGDVAALFITDEGYWRTNILFNYPPDRIAEVFVDHSDSSNRAFLLRQDTGGEFTLFSYPEGERVEGMSDSLAIRYLANFFYVPFERIANRQERILIDSLAKALPDHLIRVTGHNGSVTEVRFHRIIGKKQTGEGNGQYDPFRLHALTGEGTEMIVVPWHSVDLLLRSASYFVP